MVVRGHLGGGGMLLLSGQVFLPTLQLPKPKAEVAGGGELGSGVSCIRDPPRSSG